VFCDLFWEGTGHGLSLIQYNYLLRGTAMAESRTSKKLAYRISQEFNTDKWLEPPGDAPHPHVGYTLQSPSNGSPPYFALCFAVSFIVTAHYRRGNYGWTAERLS